MTRQTSAQLSLPAMFRAGIQRLSPWLSLLLPSHTGTTTTCLTTNLPGIQEPYQVTTFPAVGNAVSGARCRPRKYFDHEQSIAQTLLHFLFPFFGSSITVAFACCDSRSLSRVYMCSPHPATPSTYPISRLSGRFASHDLNPSFRFRYIVRLALDSKP
jgi:hypothetical protein